jgi:Flp pilus assembly protein TadD
MRMLPIAMILAATALLPLSANVSASEERTAWLLSRGQTAQAIEELEAQLGNNPFDPVTLNNLAVVRGERGDFFVSADLLRRAQRLAPGHPVIERNLRETNDWIASRARTGRIEPVAEDRQPMLPPEPPPLWR